MEAPPQQLFKKVEVLREEELSTIQGLLEEALERRLQDAGNAELTQEDREWQHAAAAGYINKLRQFLMFYDEAGSAVPTPSATNTVRTQLTPANDVGTAAGSVSLLLRSPLLLPLSPPPVDAEVAELEAEVTAAAQRVAELRASKQVRLQEELAAKLAASGPTADLGVDLGPALGPAYAGGQRGANAAPGSLAVEQQQAGAGQDVAPEAAAGELQPQPMDTENPAPAAAIAPAALAGEAAEEQAGTEAAGASTAAEPLPLSPQCEELRQRLVQVADHQPALRARLAAANDRMQRVVAAVEADLNRPPPNTVEKAVLGKTPGRPSAAAAGGVENMPGVSPLVQKALESGQISRRRRVARDVQPVPFLQSE